jgi:hypothetical protein
MGEKLDLDDLSDQVEDQVVDFLDPGCGRVWNGEADVAQRGEPFIVRPGQTHGGHGLGVGPFQGFEYVG